MEEKELDLGEYEVTWTLSGRDILKAVISVTNTGVTCLSVEAGGACYSSTPPGVTISAFTVTGYLKPVVVTPTTCIQSFKVTDSETGNPIAGATIVLTMGKGPLTTDSYGRCSVQLETGKRYGWSVLKGGYKTGYPPLFTACTAEKSIQLEPLVAPPPAPPAPPVTPPEVAKFGLSEVIENRLPDWIEGYVCTPSGAAAYKCPTGYKLTRSSLVSLYGGHGCPRTAMVFRVKCEREAPPVTTICSWIDDMGVYTLTREHARYVLLLSRGAEVAANIKYDKLSPKPSKLGLTLATHDNARGVFLYSRGAFPAGNSKTKCDY